MSERADASPASRLTPVAWGIAGSGAAAAGQFATMVLLIRAGSVEAAGVYAAALAVVTPIFMLANLQLRQLLATDVRRQHPVSDYVALRTWLLGGACLTAAAAALILEGATEVWIVTVILAVVRAVEHGADLLYGAAQRQLEFAFIGSSQILRALATTSVLGVMLMAGASVSGALLGTAIASCAVFLLFDVAAARRSIAGPLLSFRANPASLRRILRIGVPLGIVMALASVAEYAPRYVLRSYMGLNSIGVFSALLYVVLPGRLLVTTCGQLAIVRFSRQVAAGDGAGLWRTLMVFVAGTVTLGVALFVMMGIAGGDLLSWIYGDEYRIHAPMLKILVIAATVAWVNAALGQALTAARIVDGQLMVGAGTAVALFVALVLMVPRHGLYGAAYASVIGYVVQLSLFAALLCRHRVVFRAGARAIEGVAA